MMDDFSNFRTALDTMLTARFKWYRTVLAETDRSEFLDAVTAQCHATRSMINAQAVSAAREAERAKRMAPLELPCFACGQTARRLDGSWFDDTAVYEAWATHHKIIDDDNEDLAEVRASLNNHADGKIGAHAMCALVAAVHGEGLDEDWPAHAVRLPSR